jgi:hypothetical protein
VKPRFLDAPTLIVVLRAMPKIKRLAGLSSTAFLPTMKVGFFMGKMRKIVVSRPRRRAADFT